MSLDVYLTVPNEDMVLVPASIFIRENGAKRKITRDEWDARFPGMEPFVVAEYSSETTEMYSSNITHNLGKMADEAGIYEELWRPDEIGITKARQLIGPLSVGLSRLKADQKHFETFNASNGWGLYKHFVPFVEQYLQACMDNPDADVSVSR